MIKKAWCTERVLRFTNAAITSRNTLVDKTSHFICLEDEDGNVGIGECSPIYGLSLETREELDKKISEVIYLLNHKTNPSSLELNQFPSLKFAVETAYLDLQAGGKQILFDTPFTRGEESIKINGLIWMGSLDSMNFQLNSKVRKGFNCIKIKVGSHNFENEIEFLRLLREKHGWDIELRLDANGAFSASEALKKLEIMSEFKIHSIEQPIQTKKWKELNEICSKSPIPIALDEELIGSYGEEKNELLESIRPQYIILKPSLLGGLNECSDWVKKAEKLGIGWWATSFLESNLGLNAIAQWTSTFNLTLPQGLGTGQIYENNIEGPLRLDGENLSHQVSFSWDLEEISVL